MSLNWAEIDLILPELDLVGCQIQRAVQSAYDVIILKVYGRGRTRQVLVSLSPGACRIHETFRAFPKSARPLRFAEFLNSRIINGRIEAAEQLGDNRIVRLLVRQGGCQYRLYIRLWSNAANFIVTGEDGAILDAMRRLPRRGETTGGRYRPEDLPPQPGRGREYAVRELPGDKSFNEKIDDWYTEHGGGLSLDALREQARRSIEGSLGRLGASLEKLKVREAEFAAADKLREYGDIILANAGSIRAGDEWFEGDNFYGGGTIRIRLDPEKSPPAQAEFYYTQYRKAKTGLVEIRGEIAAGEAEREGLEKKLAALLEETSPLALQKLLKSGGIRGGGTGQAAAQTAAQDKKRPGLSFRRHDWLIMVGRDAAENDELLRRHVKGNDLWLHVRDFPGSHVFIKQRAGKTVPLDILLDAGNLALFYSKGRNNGAGDLFYTPVKYLRRAKNGPRGLVIPTQEKNLHITLDERRLKELEPCRIEK
jgi:predicted ribosome quality control (RQC) complex YloA/Tae2 family protein